jgi:hypothetical protein
LADQFEITFDYLCPFARNANEAVIEGLRAGAAWDVRFRPFSLAQTKVDEREPPVWERQPGEPGTSGVLALQWGVAGRDRFPDEFPDLHLGLFAARHDHGEDIGDERVLAAVASTAGIDPHALEELVASGEPARRLAAEHEELVRRWAVFGVPTFIAGTEAVFVRQMERHRSEDIPRIINMIGWTELNEFKRTRIPR